MIDSTYKPWGKSLSINLFDCDISKISHPDSIKLYISEVIAIIDMVAYGPCHIERFGHGDLEGYSAMQFIETSSITIHCDEPKRRCFIDIFSCKDFDSNKAKEFSKEYFGAQHITSASMDR